MDTIVCPGGRDNAFIRGLRGGRLQCAEWSTDPGRIVTWWGAVFDIRPGDFLVFFAVPTGLAFEAVIPGGENHPSDG